MHIARYIEIMMSAPNAMQNSVVTMFSIADLSRLKSVEYPVGYSKDINRSKKIFFSLLADLSCNVIHNKSLDGLCIDSLIFMHNCFKYEGSGYASLFFDGKDTSHNLPSNLCLSV